MTAGYSTAQIIYFLSWALDSSSMTSLLVSELTNSGMSHELGCYMSTRRSSIFYISLAAEMETS